MEIMDGINLHIYAALGEMLRAAFMAASTIIPHSEQQYLLPTQALLSTTPHLEQIYSA